MRQPSTYSISRTQLKAMTSGRFICTLALALCLTSMTVLAQRDPALKNSTTFPNYRIQHVVFNSTFVLPEVAQAYGLKRSKYESLVNISVYPSDATSTLPATISGTATNLMQQQKTLNFKKIEEQDAVYYLAPVHVGNEELLHFSLAITPEGSAETLELKFSQTVYADE